MGVRSTKEYVAALDLGTNTFNLSIANSNAPFSIEYRTERGVFLGKGGLAEQRIVEDAALRAQKVLEDYSDILSNYPLTEVRCVATEAIRNAKNAHEVLRFLEIDINFNVETIAGDKEATLVYKGVKSTGILGNENVLIMDIGGGSIEFIIANDEEIWWKKSFKIGTSRVLELYPLSDPPLAAELHDHYLYYKTKLQELRPLLKEYKVATLIGTAGSFDAWRKMLGSDDVAPTCELNEEALLECIQKVNAASFLERIKIPGMEEMRVETIIPAGILLNFLAENFQFKTIFQCSFALAEGVLWEMIYE